MTAPTIEADAVVIGAGPVGLFQVFQLGLLEVHAHVIDALPYAGGQCVELYPDKPIYDIPAVPATTGRALTQSLLKQIAPFGAQMHLGQQVESLYRSEDGRLHLSTTTGQSFITPALFIAAGVGAFVPRKLQVEGFTALEGHCVYYPQTNDFLVRHAPHLTGKHVVVLGGGASAVYAALELLASPEGAPPASITLIHRRDVFDAPPEALAALRDARARGAIQVIAGQVMGFTTQGMALQTLELLGANGEMQSLCTQTVLAYLGVSPKLGPIAQWGLALERKQITVNTEDYGTELPGVFAVGDINTYPGKKKLIVCGFHEATLAAYGAMRFIAPDKKVMLQYTTTSPRLHALLGVNTPAQTEKIEANLKKDTDFQKILKITL